MSSPEQSKKNDKTRETCRRGPEDGYPFVVDEVFKQRSPEPLPEPVTVRRVSRSVGPHRANKLVAAADSERTAIGVENNAQRSTFTQVSSTQNPANNSLAVSSSGTNPSSRISETTRGQDQIKDNPRPVKSADRPASIHTAMPGIYAESDDGGVELSEHNTSETNHDTARRVQAGSGSDSSGPATPEDDPKQNDGSEGRGQLGAGNIGAEDAHEGDKLESIFARLDALNRPRHE